MHEIGLMSQAVQIALARAEQGGGQRVHRLTMRIGPLGGVAIDALRFAFEVVTHGTAADGAELHIEEVPVRCWCAACACEFQPDDYVFRCPSCQQISADVRQGWDLDLIALEFS
jgi:hydrogenase nickel incorporation protein HypA/HybF